ncbi:hypothetical protein CSOJ01_14130 [Colletotrichum sojae]|uniref:Uncharacterized protein n=1 Tax=Colletotrichum sojae TaxID=2175907 RepID=A0A8H6IRB2_9PEZI|nr:hypothetical protein CSOJ01_14130 [Colletotrichum sojae]
MIEAAGPTDRHIKFLSRRNDMTVAAVRFVALKSEIELQAMDHGPDPPAACHDAMPRSTASVSLFPTSSRALGPFGSRQWAMAFPSLRRQEQTLRLHAHGAIVSMELRTIAELDPDIELLGAWIITRLQSPFMHPPRVPALSQTRSLRLVGSKRVSEQFPVHKIDGFMAVNGRRAAP